MLIFCLCEDNASVMMCEKNVSFLNKIAGSDYSLISNDERFEWYQHKIPMTLFQFHTEIFQNMVNISCHSYF